MLILWTLLCFQTNFDLNPNTPRSWETMARPWMLVEEARLYDSLSPFDKMRFRGTFVARRSQEPNLWSETGMNLPCFYAPQTFGDIRDQILYALGEPEARFPLWWTYAEGRRFHFVRQKGQLTLAAESLETWQDVLRERIRHPALRYDFRTPVFGEVAIPPELPVAKTSLDGLWLTPTSGDTQITLVPQLSDAFLKLLEGPGDRYPVMRMHVDVLRDEAVVMSRANATRIERERPDHPSFSVTLPPGYHHIRARFWIQNVAMGLEIEQKVYLPARHTQGIGSPMLFAERHPAGIEVPYESGIFLDNYFYPLLPPDPLLKKARWAVVHCLLGQPQLFIQRAEGNGRLLEASIVDGDRYLFELDNLAAGDRLVALAPKSDTHPVRAISAWPLQMQADLPVNSSLSLREAGSNYLYHEALQVEGHRDNVFLFAQGQAFAMSENGRFPWDIYDWGQRLDIQAQTFNDGKWTQGNFFMERTQTFAEIAVSHPFLILGMRDSDGKIVEPDIKIYNGAGKELAFEKQPLPDLKTMTGILLTPSVTRSIRWPDIRESLQQWLERDIRAEDAVYLIYATDEPAMVQLPTQTKSLIEASLRGLPYLDPQTEPPLRRRQEALWKTYGRRLSAVVAEGSFGFDVGSFQNRPKIDINQGKAEFTPAQFMESLRHMGRSFGGPHRILVITDQLNTEPQTTPEVLLQLRQSGMQFFALELPFAQESNRANNADALGTISQDGFDAPMRLMRDHPNVTPLEGDSLNGGSSGKVSALRFKWGNKKGKEMSAALPAIEATYVERFNQQVAARSAGVGAVAGTLPEVKAFFEELSAWKVHLVHLNIPAMTDPDDLRIQASKGGHPFWLAVPWNAP